MSFKKACLLTTTSLVFSHGAFAEESWDINWTPYLWAANLQADVKAGPIDGGADLDTKDILDKLDMAFMHYLEFSKGDWGIANEIIYLDLSQTTQGPIGGAVQAEVGLTQLINDLVVTYKIDDTGNTTLIAGARYNSLDMGVDIIGPDSGTIPLSSKESWTNVLFGLRQIVPINNEWSFLFKGDVATDFSDELSYILTAGANYQMTDLLDLKFGYRYAKVEFKKDTFDLDETVDGAFVGMTFKW